MAGGLLVLQCKLAFSTASFMEILAVEPFERPVQVARLMSHHLAITAAAADAANEEKQGEAGATSTSLDPPPSPS